MKKASELGLSVRVVKDKVFLLKGGSIDLNGEGIAFDVNDLIACSEQMGSFPLLVIEDEVENLADQEFQEQKESYENSTEMFAFDYPELLAAGFKIGYNKAKETFKFTEDDMVEFAMNMISQYQFGNTNIHNRGILMESLPKKELYVEVEYQDMMDMWVSPPTILEYCNSPMRAKITDNKIKAVWK